jgi:hypothetical protein
MNSGNASKLLLLVDEISTSNVCHCSRVYPMRAAMYWPLFHDHPHTIRIHDPIGRQQYAYGANSFCTIAALILFNCAQFKQQCIVNM